MAGILVQADRLLLCRRPAGRPQAGWWEFPGGKLEPGEGERAALARELAEELGIAVAGAKLRLLLRRRHYYGETGWLELAFYWAPGWRGQPLRRHYAELRWVAAARLGRYPLLAADRQALGRLRRRLRRLMAR